MSSSCACCLSPHKTPLCCAQIMLGLGGSATNDAGLGALQAMGLRVFSDGELLLRPVTGADLRTITALDPAPLHERYADITVRIACDVDSVFVGPQGAVEVAFSLCGVIPLPVWH